MKKVLIITYYWPPSGGAGVQRWLKFIKYLPDFGWQPIVFTVKDGEYPVLDNGLEKEVPKEIEVHKTPAWEPYGIYKSLAGKKKSEGINSGFLSEKKGNGFIENLSKWVRGNLFIPDARKFWIKPSIKYLEKYLNQHKIDAVISSGPPHSAHLIALKLKSQFDIPWVSDFRDPWTNIDFYKELKLTKLADKKHKRLEKQVLNNADLVLTVGNQLSNELNDLGANRVEVIENGYDPEDFIVNEEIEIDKKFSIAHIGSFTPSRNHQVLWDALHELVNENPAFKSDLQLKLIGKVDHTVLQSIEDHGLNSFVQKINYVPHSEVVKLQRTSRLLLLMVNNTPNAKGIITGKVFEYMASKRPILVVGPEDGDLNEIIKKANAGLVCGYDDVEKLKSTILGFYSNELNFNCEPSSYSRKILTKKLASLLNNLEA